MRHRELRREFDRYDRRLALRRARSSLLVSYNASADSSGHQRFTSPACQNCRISALALPSLHTCHRQLGCVPQGPNRAVSRPRRARLRISYWGIRSRARQSLENSEIVCPGRLISSRVRTTDRCARHVLELTPLSEPSSQEIVADRARLEAAVDQFGLRDVCIFAGSLPRPELLARMAASILVVVPSRSEALGIVAVGGDCHEYSGDRERRRRSGPNDYQWSHLDYCATRRCCRSRLGDTLPTGSF